ncbi:MAG: CdaR family protein [Oscillospiraceae bacterium]|nr:CdaR family protein [Oscillospiraceae bacterium]MDY6209222.1 CdaR family protein [Oscillospiraceae bacterium]
MIKEKKPTNPQDKIQKLLKSAKDFSPAEALNFFTQWITNIFKQDTHLKILSIIVAIGIWAVVSISVYPTMESVYYNVPVKISLENTYAEANQLDVITSSAETVTVKLSGNRSQIGEIKAEDLTAAVDVSSVMLPRSYKLPMNIECAKSADFDVVSIEPETVSVSFDKIISKELTITPQLENVRIAEGYMSGDAVVTPSTVTVTGPQDMVNSITKVCAKVSPEKELDSTYEFTTDELVLYNNNAVISDNNEMLSFDKSAFAIQIPVFVRQTLPLEVNIINAPDKFDLDYFRSQLVFSVNVIDIAAPNDKIKELKSLNIGTINMREVDVGSVFEFKAENFLPEGYENLTQIDTVTVTCPSEGIKKKAIAIKGKDIQFVNRPAQYEFEPVSSGMTLFVVGDEEQIDSITREDITAQIDLIDFDMQEGDHKMSVGFIISSYDKVWFNGGDGIATPKIIVKASVAEDEVLEE